MPLKLPPHDNDGVIPHDHEGILPGDGIIRRISLEHIVFDPKIQGERLSSAAFNPSSGLNGGMSIDLQQQIEEAGLDARIFVTTPIWPGSVLFKAGQLRAEGFLVGYDPVTGNPYHGQVWGNFTRAKVNKLRCLCVWFVQIKNVSTGCLNMQRPG